jgi:hypothetical protein
MNSIQQFESSVGEMQTHYAQEFEWAHVWGKGMGLIVI